MKKTSFHIYIFLMSLYLIGTSGHFFSMDEVTVYLTTESLVLDGDLSIGYYLDTIKGRDGNYYCGKGILQTLISVPLFVVGHIFDTTLSKEQKRFFEGYPVGKRREWAGKVPYFFVNLLNAFVVPFLCVVLYWLLIELNFDNFIATICALLTGLATLVGSYAYFYFQHPLETLFILLTFLLIIKSNKQKRESLLLWAGVTAALGLTTRINVTIVLPWTFLYILLTGPRLKDWQSHLRRLLLFSVPLVLGYGGFFLVNFIKFGNPQNTGYVVHFSTPLLKGLYGFLLSIGKSIFIYSPPIILAFWGIRSFSRTKPYEALTFGGTIVTYILFYSKWIVWSGDWCWGPRFVIPIVPLMMIFTAETLSNLQGNKKFQLALIAVFCLSGMIVQFLGIAVYLSNTYLRDWVKIDPIMPYVYNYEPSFSPLVIHWKHICEQNIFDFWVHFLFREYGLGVVLGVIAIPLILLCWSGLALVHDKGDD